MMKGQSGILTWVVLIAIVIVILAAVILPIIFEPVVPTVTTYSNTTTLTDLNASLPALANQTFVLSLISVEADGGIAVTHDGVNQSVGNVTVQLGGTALGVLTSATTNTFTIPAASLSTDMTILFNATANLTNITQGDLTYYQLSEAEQNGWNNAVITFWELLLSIVVIAGVIIFILRT